MAQAFSRQRAMEGRRLVQPVQPVRHPDEPLPSRALAPHQGTAARCGVNILRNLADPRVS